MWSVARSLLDLVRSWQDQGDRVYQIVAGAAAWLAIASVFRGARPSQLISALMDSLGAAPLAQWFGSGAPPMLAFRSPNVQVTVLWLILGLLIYMIAVPLWNGRNDRWSLMFLEPLGLLGSRSASTVWCLFLIALQLGPIEAAHGTLGDGLPTLGVAIVLVWAVLASANADCAPRRESPWFEKALSGGVCAGLQLLLGCLGVICAVIFGALFLPLGIARWVVAVRTDRWASVRDKAELAQEFASLPSGAVR